MRASSHLSLLPTLSSPRETDRPYLVEWDQSRLRDKSALQSSLAAFYMQKAGKCSSVKQENERRTWMEKATATLNRMERMAMANQDNKLVLGRAFFFMLQGDLEKARFGKRRDFCDSTPSGIYTTDPCQRPTLPSLSSNPTTNHSTLS